MQYSGKAEVRNSTVTKGGVGLTGRHRDPVVGVAQSQVTQGAEPIPQHLLAPPTPQPHTATQPFQRIMRNGRNAVTVSVIHKGDRLWGPMCDAVCEHCVSHREGEGLSDRHVVAETLSAHRLHHALYPESFPWAPL